MVHTRTPRGRARPCRAFGVRKHLMTSRMQRDRARPAWVRDSSSTAVRYPSAKTGAPRGTTLRYRNDYGSAACTYSPSDVGHTSVTSPGGIGWVRFRPGDGANPAEVAPSQSENSLDPCGVCRRWARALSVVEGAWTTQEVVARELDGQPPLLKGRAMPRRGTHGPRPCPSAPRVPSGLSEATAIPLGVPHHAHAPPRRLPRAPAGTREAARAELERALACAVVRGADRVASARRSRGPRRAGGSRAPAGPGERRRWGSRNPPSARCPRRRGSAARDRSGALP